MELASENKDQDSKVVDKQEKQCEESKVESGEEKKVDNGIVEAVAERLKFFFSDANIRQDYFMRKKLLDKQSEYPQQVQIFDLMRFNTVKKHTTDADIIIRAAKTLPEKLTISEDNRAIGLVDAFTLNKMKGNIPVTLHVGNVPVDSDKRKYLVDNQEIRKLFEQYGTVSFVKLRFKRAEDGEENNDWKNKVPIGGRNARM